ncbi:MAG TPA: DEAD/DEAH box helicase [Firmicutes bacterium]|nr:DEAD/DEAH box helicase [Candidatus Fermentithermobacillaceae bacterium]
MPLNPIIGSRAIKDSYISYLKTTFPIKDPDLQAQFIDLISEPERLVKGPILEAVPPFEVTVSVEDLVKEGVLSPLLMQIPETELPKKRPLYWHQEQAIRKAVTLRRNLVIASGTGSGKTECFLVPILNTLLKEQERGTLTPGVRALLLYPMNALANDQMKRLRGLLSHLPNVTFGRYTGETKEKPREARDLYLQMYGSEPLPNEKVSRVEMRDEPPHILLTNYAMLEYLLLRPEDNSFFDGLYAGSWQYIVLDEAHTYSGAKGIEIAMLLRRLKERVTLSRKGRLQCFATSATLGNGVKDAPEIARFAESLFDEEFAWEPDDPSRQDIILARRVEYCPSSGVEEPGLFRPNPQLYFAWRDMMRWHLVVGTGEDTAVSTSHDYGELLGPDNENKVDAAEWGAAMPAAKDRTSGARDIGYLLQELVSLGMKHGIPENHLTGPAAGAQGMVDRFLYLVLEKDKNLVELRARLKEKPAALDELAKELFPDRDDASEILVALVDLAVRARLGKESSPLLPARYHLFIKAIEGAYLQFRPEHKLSLERKEVNVCDGKNWPVFEIATCRNCGHLYLFGRIDQESSSLKQESFDGEQGRSHYFMVVNADSGAVADDEDELVVFSNVSAQGWQRFVLCGSCGKVWAENAVGQECRCGREHRLLLMRAPSAGDVYYCPACGRRNPTGLVFRFFTGQDATATVIATSVYQSISQNGGAASTEEPVIGAPAARKSNYQETQRSEWSAEIPRTAETFGRLLVFSDSRQDAAFFAPYLDRTYNQILARSLIYRTVSSNRDRVLSRSWRVQDLVSPLAEAARKAGVFKQGQGHQEQRSMVWRWLLQEFLRHDRHNSLESLGLVSFRPAKPDYWIPPRPLLEAPWNLTEEEIWGLIRVLLDTLRANGAVLFPDEVSPTDEAFAPRNWACFVRQHQADPRNRILAWSPSPGVSNARLDFLIRVADKIGVKNPIELCREVLDRLWDSHFKLYDGRSLWAQYFEASTQPGAGTVYQLRYDMWELDVPGPNEDETTGWYRCSICGYVTRVNVKGICPNYQCRGTLRPLKGGIMRSLFSSDQEDDAPSFQNHYARLYRTLRPVALRAEEHTAQLKPEVAAELQTKFSKGDISVLSCSTTFELGVDLGSLEAVFLRNMPPTPANYVQRAGRAGRRTGSAAFVVTFAQRRSHDMEYYRNPERMVAGVIRPPHFKMANEKVIRRHVYAMALAYLWKTNRSIYGRGEVKDFFTGRAGIREMTAMLAQRPEELLSALIRTVPEDLHGKLGIKDWEWVRGLLDDEIGVLVRAGDEFEHDTQVLQEILASLQKQRKPSDHILRALNTVEQRELIGYLAARSVLPKYGFPVDSVELRLNNHSPHAQRLELERDLRMALSEYAPGSKIVAGGKMWTSRYLRLLPRRTWICYRFAICDNCGSYDRVLADSAEELTTCKSCGASLARVRQRGQYVVPEFGFVSEPGAPEDPPQTRPQRHPFPRVHFWGPSLESNENMDLQLGGFQIHTVSASRGRLAALNTCGGAGFRVCFDCGYSVPGNEKAPREHKDPYGRPCGGTFHRVNLGHEFETDVLLVSFPGYHDTRDGFWPSLLYGLLEGLSLTLDVERSDLDGCLYPVNGRLFSPALVLYDNVPGGAGHVRRAADPSVLKDILKATRSFLASCECGTSCSGCLRNFRNQYWHDKLNRHWVLEFLNGVLGEG